MHDPDGGEIVAVLVMWSGVIVITRTMTTWTVTRATIATGTFGRRRIDAERTRRRALAAGLVVARRRVGEGVRIGPERERASGSRPRRRTRPGRGRRPTASGSPSRVGEVAGRRGEVRPDDRRRRSRPRRRSRAQTRVGPAGTGPPRRSAIAGSRRCRSRSAPSRRGATPATTTTTATVATTAPETPIA